MTVKRPNSRRNLDYAIQRAFGTGQAYVDARTVMANAIVGQMLPSGVVKGGFSLKLRYGVAGTRFTTDLDTARATDIKTFRVELAAALEYGWEGFTGAVVVGRQTHPKGVPQQYVMQPLEVKLSYNEKPWVTVPLEVGHDEIGDADEAEWGISPEVAAMFEAVGLPAPGPSPLMPLHFQVAQKLHGVTEPGGRRAHDLIDLQLMARDPKLDLSMTKEVCVRLFKYRKMQEWPPTVIKGEGWEERYGDQLSGLDVLQSVDEAVVWANELIARIDAS